MKALILNSGIGKRMGELTKTKNKCMAELSQGITIIDWQLELLQREGMKEAVITTGPFSDALMEHVTKKHPGIHVTFRHNPSYDSTNYIYSIALAQDVLQGDDIILMHGDLVFEQSVLHDIMESKASVMAIDKSLPLPEKDFKAVVEDGKITKVGIEFFENAYAAQPLYKMLQVEWNLWLEEIMAYCGRGERSVYAEHALNDISSQINLEPFDVNARICMEVDNLEDLERARGLMEGIIVTGKP